jgi:hypothetical protein
MGGLTFHHKACNPTLVPTADLKPSPVRSTSTDGADNMEQRESEGPMGMKPGIAAFFAVAAAVFLAAALGGCASSFNVVGDPFVAPAKFQFLRCVDIAKRLETTKAREQELRTLMDRASAGTGGSTVNMFVYQPEYQTVTSELQQLHEEAVAKQCPPEPAKAETKADTKKTDSKKPGA